MSAKKRVNWADRTADTADILLDAGKERVETEERVETPPPADMPGNSIEHEIQNDDTAVSVEQQTAISMAVPLNDPISPLDIPVSTPPKALQQAINAQGRQKTQPILPEDKQVNPVSEDEDDALRIILSEKKPKKERMTTKTFYLDLVLATELSKRAKDLEKSESAFICEILRVVLKMPIKHE